MTTSLSTVEQVMFALILRRNRIGKFDYYFFLKLQCTLFFNSRLTAVQWMGYKSLIHSYRIVSPLLLKANGGNSLILS